MGNGDNAETCATNDWQHVLWGSKWGALPHHPRGSTLTFQLNAGVPCGTGLRHGVIMHPRGRHLREGMILLPHGMTHPTAREKQLELPLQQHYYNDNTMAMEKRKGEQAIGNGLARVQRNNGHHNGQCEKLGKFKVYDHVDWIHVESGIHHCHHQHDWTKVDKERISPAKRQSRELCCTFMCGDMECVTVG